MNKIKIVLWASLDSKEWFVHLILMNSQSRTSVNYFEIQPSFIVIALNIASTMLKNIPFCVPWKFKLGEMFF